ncbi:MULTISPECIES: DNA gyrase subunit A [Allofournierella]|uniref:DNA gyrase subunit A n=1 Tax=Allofournierella massiliensis TaxID=1650663 RepID=A0ABT7UU82_9FIRM|nr:MULTISPECIES: DNA gyrase subunit A [Fournierella]MDM8202427.1 DNA gyrase subunit A [Fournierella massiliensis]
MIENSVTPGTHLIVRDVKDEIERAFLDYSMSVIVSRALPDVRDGLKPVHRRILYTMYERGNDPSHPYRKSADTVGAVLGSYHPHGDASVYDAMVRLAQDFSMRYPLVDGQGNFGSVDGDPPAAYRYTEARMSKMAVDLLTDIEKDTVDFGLNFDETKKEPTVLPSRFPNLLVNGSTGIAVGMATNIPPHNLTEVIEGAVALIDDPDIDLAGLMEHIKGPDFPTGGIIMGRSGIRAAYATGRGKITLRGRAEIEEKKNGRFQIIVTEIPYMVNKARLIENIADLVKEKRIEGISDLNDESNRHGMRIVIELKKDANPQVVLNQLYRYTQLQDTVGVHLLALDGGVPKTMTLKTMLERYVAFQAQVVRRRTAFDLKKAEERAHILEGLKRATDIVDEIIATIRACKGGQAEARVAIMERFGFDELQAAAICAFRLGQLAGLEILKIESELAELQGNIAEWRSILASDEKVYAIVKEELTVLKEKYGDDRRTEIAHVSGEVDIEDLIPVEQCVFTLTHEGYIKRQPQDTYQVQKRGGRGISGLSHKDEDFVEELFIGSTHDFVLFVTDQGRVYRLKGYQIYEGSRTSRGTNIVNLLPLQNGEKVTSMLRMPAENAEGYLVMVTRQGVIKRTPIEAYANIRKSGLLAVSMYEGDSLAWTQITTGEDELIVATHDGLAIRFNEQDARSMGRLGHGVRAIRLAEGDYVVGVGVVHPGATVFTVTENGKGRRSRIDDYRLQSRGGKGIRNYGKGEVAGIKVLEEEDDIILISQEGIIIRMHAADINIQSRYGSGVRVMRLGEGDRVVTVARTEHSDDAEVEKPENEPEEALSEEELAALAAEEAAQAEEPVAADDEEE